MLASFLTLISMQSCAHISGTDYCIVAQPITVSSEDRLSTQTKQEIVAHNSKWRHFCT